VNINLTLLGQAISFVIFVWFCMKYVWPPIIKVMEDRQAKIAAGLRDAERAEHDLKQAQLKGQEIVAESKSQAAGLIEQANKRAAQIVDDARALAQQEGDRIKQQAESDVAQQAQVAREALRAEVAKLAILGAEKILEKQISSSDHERMLSSFIQDA